VLDRGHRLTSSAAFATTARRGARAGSRTLVLHLAAAPSPAPVAGTCPDQPRVGFVVSKAVGGAVTRNRVQRRLRHLVADRLEALPPGSALVVRALPSSAAATYRGLGRDLDTALGRLGIHLDAQDGTVTAP
jgi:ribonuclease P protein component